MPDLVVANTVQFSGWPAFIERCKRLGGRRGCLALSTSVANHIAQNDGIFVGDGGHNFANQTLLCRVLLRIWLDELATNVAPTSPFTPEELAELKTLLLEANTLVFKSPMHGVPPSGHAGKRMLAKRISESQWIAVLRHRLRTVSSKSEISRSWLFVRKYWPIIRRKLEDEQREKRKKKPEIKIPDPLLSAFDAFEYAFLLDLAVLKFGPHIPHPSALFTNTTFSQAAPQFIEWYAADATAVVGDWQTLISTSNALESPFVVAPVLRLPDGSLFAPDPSLLAGATAERMMSRTMLGYSAMSSSEHERANTVRGDVFEHHVQKLIERCAALCAAAQETYVPEFTIDGGRSPDAFIMSPSVALVFEAKSTAYPRPYDKHWKLDELEHWLAKLGGERKDEQKLPFEQGSRFFEKWRTGNQAAVQALGEFPGFPKIRYIIVSSEAIPSVVHWPAFRELWTERQRFTKAQLELLARTTFISLRDLECLTMHLEKNASNGTSTTDALEKWITYWASTPDIMDPEANLATMKGSLWDFLVRSHPENTAALIPQFMRDAYDEAFEYTKSLAFDNGGA